MLNKILNNNKITKFLISFLFIFVICSIFLYSCDSPGSNNPPQHIHSWVDATCTAPKTCTQCGATEGSVTSHNWSEATCAAPKTCSICGATEGNPAEHTLTAVCTVCGNTNAEYVELANKTWGYTDKDGSTIEIAQYSFYEGSLEIGYTNYKTLEKIAEDRNEDIAAIREEYTQYGMLKVIDGVEYGYNGWGMDNWSARKYTEENGVVTILFLSLDWDDNDEEVWTTKRTAILTRTGFREYTVTGGDYCKIGLKLTPAE